MVVRQSNSYAQCRALAQWHLALHETDGTPPERLLQAVWFHQRLKRDQLRTLDGRALRVLHPGFWNREPGPDFRHAVIQLEDHAPRTVDVEVDLHSSGWHAHGHDVNPNFQGVGLHVVWRAERPVAIPTLALEPVLDSPLTELATGLGSDTAKSLPLEFMGQCCAPLREWSEEALNDLLRQAALARWETKAAWMQARAREAGWEQTLWEGLFRALGYKHNRWPMQRLGELRPRLTSKKHGVLLWQALLLGVAGLLPQDLPGGVDAFVRQLWDVWWRERDALADVVLPRSLWKFGGIRPANHPQRRLALAARWLAEGKLPARIEKWALKPCQDGVLLPSLVEVFKVEDDPFWSTHWTLQSPRLLQPQPLIGAARVTDLAVNVVLPWLWVRASEGRNAEVRAEMERRFLQWPRAEDNAILRLARQRLLGGSKPRQLPGAISQQGLLQIVRDFCEHSNAVCAECRFPEIVRKWQRDGK